MYISRWDFFESIIDSLSFIPKCKHSNFEMDFLKNPTLLVTTVNVIFIGYTLVLLCMMTCIDIPVFIFLRQ